MESKRSFFNFKMILRDIKMHWPIWTVTLAVYLLSCTTIISLEGGRSFSSDNNRPLAVAHSIIEILTADSFFLAACLGFIVAVAAFGFLGKRRKHYFFESLPFSKTSLFATRFLFGVIIMFIPVFSIYIVEIFQSAAHDYCAIGELTQWLLISIAEYLFWYALGIIIVVISGRLAMAGFCYIAVTVVWLLFELVLEAYSHILYLGFDGGLGLLFNYSDMNIFSPLEFFEAINLDFTSDVQYEIYPDGTFLKVLIALIAATVLIALALMLYKRRKAEKTEDNFVFAPVKVIFSCLFAFFFSLGFTIFFTGVFISSDEGQAHILSRRIGILMLVIICGFIGYMASCMIVEKRFKIFKENMVKCCIFLAVLTVFMIAMFHDVFNIERYVPDKENCTYAYISGEYVANGETYFKRFEKKEAVEKIVELHQIIVDNMDDLIDNIEARYRDYSHYNYIDLTIRENGRALNRSYYIRENSTLDKKIKQFFADNKDLFKNTNIYDDIGYYEYDYYYD